MARKVKSSSTSNTGILQGKKFKINANPVGTISLGNNKCATYEVLDIGNPIKLSDVELGNKRKRNQSLIRESQTGYVFNHKNIKKDMIYYVNHGGKDKLIAFFAFLCTYYGTSETLPEIIKCLSEVLKSEFNETIGWDLYFDEKHPILGPALNGQQTNAETSLLEYKSNADDAVKEKIVKEILQNHPDEKMPLTNKEFKELAKKYNYTFGTEVGFYFEGNSDNTLNCFVRDNGIGVNASQFKDTLLSVGQGNKAELGYLEGKHNFGSTSIWGYISYKSILSKMASNLKGADNRYGFTLVQKRYIDGDVDLHHECVYLTINGEIPSFELKDGFECLYGGLGDTLNNGTLIKLYGLRMSGVSEKTTKSFINKFNSIMVSPLFKTEMFSLKEFISAEKKDNYRRNLYGRTALIDEALRLQMDSKSATKKIDYRDFVKVTFSESCFNDSYVKLPVSEVVAYMDVTILNSEYTANYISGSNKEADYLYGSLDSKTVIYSDYGQRHGYDLISTVKNKVKLPGYPRIANNVMITVYLDDLPIGLKTNILSTNREQMKDVPFANILRKFVFNFIDTYYKFELAVEKDKDSVKNDTYSMFNRIISKQTTESKRMMDALRQYNILFNSDINMDDISEEEKPFYRYSCISNKRREPYYMPLQRNGKSIKKYNMYTTGVDYDDFIKNRNDYKVDTLFLDFNMTRAEYNSYTNEPPISKAKSYHYDINNPSSWDASKVGIEIEHGFTYKIDTDKYGVTDDKKKLCISYTLSPNNKIIKSDWCYGLRVVVHQKGYVGKNNSDVVYEGTCVLSTTNGYKTGKVRSNTSRKMSTVTSENKIALPGFILVSNSNNYPDTITYKKLLSSYSIQMDNNKLLAYDRSGIKLNNIFFNLDNDDFQEYLRNSNVNMEEYCEHALTYAIMTYYLILVRVAQKRLKGDSEEKISLKNIELTVDEDNFIDISLEQSSYSLSSMIKIS